jgi:hypothetical protein
MNILRQIAASLAQGVQSSLVGAGDLYTQQLTDVRSSWILQLAASGQFSSDLIVLAASGTATIALPQGYTDDTQPLYVAIASTETIELTYTHTTLGVSKMMIQAGNASDQQGLVAFCGPTQSLALANPQTSSAVVEWFLFQVPPLTTNTSWFFGSQSTGTLGYGGTQ